MKLTKVRRAASEERKNLWSAAFEVAERAYERADYDHCLKLLDVASANAPADAGQVSLLRARCARFLGDDEMSYAAAAAASRDCETVAERLAASVLQAIAAKHLHEVDEARELFTSLSATVLATPVFDSGEARYLLAGSAFEDDDVEGAKKWLEPNVHAGVFEAESLALAGTIAMSQCNYRDAAASFTEAQRTMSSAGSVDARLEAVTLASLATIAAETVDLELAKRSRNAYAKMEWPESLLAERFAACEGLRIIALLEGDVSAAFFAAREGVGLAPVPALEAVAETQLAAISHILGDLGAEKLQLKRAWDVLRLEKAGAYDPVVAYAFAAFAAEASGVLPAEAKKAMVSYRSLVTKATSPIDKRLETFATIGTGRLAEASGDRQAALRQYRTAFDNWQALGLDLRAALAAVDLRRLTGDDAYLKPVRPVLLRAPKAWFADELKRGRNPLTRLTPAERVVLARLLRGETAKAISEALDRSPFTISNHTRKIFAAFNLNSRSKVIARCVELGITPDALDRES